MAGFREDFQYLPHDVLPAFQRLIRIGIAA
jgi:hypothetical protein